MVKLIDIKEKIIISVLFIYLFLIFFIENSTLSLIPFFSKITDITSSFFIISCCIFIVFFNKYSVNELVIIIGCAILLFIVWLMAGSSPLLELLIIIVGLKKIPLKKILNTYFCTQLIAFCSIFILYYLSLIPERIVFRDGIERSSLGFWHPNTLGLMLMSLLLLSIISKNKWKRLYYVFFFNLINIITYPITGSRTSFYLIILSTIIFVLTHIFKLEKSRLLKIKLIIPLSFIGLSILTIVIVNLYIKGNHYAIGVNKLMTNRISIGSRFFDEYGLSIFGQKVRYNSPNYLTQSVINFEYRVLDNIYLKYFINYGVITIGLFSSYLYAIAYKLNNKYIVLWNSYFLIFILLGLSEQSAFNYLVNFFVIFGVLLLSPEINDEFIGNKLSEES